MLRAAKVRKYRSVFALTQRVGPACVLGLAVVKLSSPYSVIAREVVPLPKTSFPRAAMMSRSLGAAGLSSFYFAAAITSKSSFGMSVERDRRVTVPSAAKRKRTEFAAVSDFQVPTMLKGQAFGAAVWPKATPLAASVMSMSG
jgi:hypothetical protein